MAENFTITEAELEAIRSVSAYIGTIAHEDAFRPSNAVQDDRNEVHRMLSRLAPAPPIEEVASRPGDWAKDLAEDSQGPSVVDRGCVEIEMRWAKEAIGLTAVELNEAYAQFDVTRYEIPAGHLNRASERLEEIMQCLGQFPHLRNGR